MTGSAKGMENRLYSTIIEYKHKIIEKEGVNISRKTKQGGYLQKSYPSSKNLYSYIWSLTEKLPLEGDARDVLNQRKAYHRFLSHLYVGSRLQTIDEAAYSDRKEFVPISSRLLEREFGRGFDVHLLKDNGLIEITGHRSVQKQSREFRLTKRYHEEATEIELKTLIGKYSDSDFHDVIVNLMAGRKITAPLKSEYTKYEGATRNTNIPKLIRESMKSLKPCPFNPKLLVKWVNKLKGRYLREQKLFSKVKTECEEKCASVPDR